MFALFVMSSNNQVFFFKYSFWTMIELYGGYIRYVRQWIVFVSQISLLLVSLFSFVEKKKPKIISRLGNHSFQLHYKRWDTQLNPSSLSVSAAKLKWGFSSPDLIKSSSNSLSSVVQNEYRNRFVLSHPCGSARKQSWETWLVSASAEFRNALLHS